MEEHNAINIKLTDEQTYKNLLKEDKEHAEEWKKKRIEELKRHGKVWSK